MHSAHRHNHLKHAGAGWDESLEAIGKQSILVVLEDGVESWVGCGEGVQLPRGIGRCDDTLKNLEDQLRGEIADDCHPLCNLESVSVIP